MLPDSKHNLDNYGIRKEFTYQYLIYIAISITAMIPYFIVNDIFFRLWIFEDALTIACFLMIIVTTKIILNDCAIFNDLSELVQEDQNRNEAEPALALIDCLHDPTGTYTMDNVLLWIQYIHTK